MTQDKALEILKSGKNVFLTGEPGAGKTHTINRFHDWLEEQGRHAEVTASTGIAATHINGVTIHSWSGLGIKEHISDADLKNILRKDYVVRRIAAADILIIDEISMLNAETLDNVDRIVRRIRQEWSMDNATKPFGGMQVIFVGDFFQLPPVTKGRALAKFAFESNAWLAAEPVICYLTEQHRQSDPVFLDILTAFRQGTLTEKHKDILRGRKIPAPKDITRLFTHNRDVDSINAIELEKVEGPVKTFYMESFGIEFLVETLKKNCLSPEELDLKVGAKVMFTRNHTRNKRQRKDDYFEPQYVNGTLGEVIGFTESGKEPIVLTKDGREIFVEPVEWSIEEKGTVKASISQYPLRLAWAITVHKCQGMSLDAATMDLSEAFEFGQGYVALSRVRSLEGLYLEGINARAYMMHPTVVKKDAMFRKLSEM